MSYKKVTFYRSVKIVVTQIPQKGFKAYNAEFYIDANNGLNGCTELTPEEAIANAIQQIDNCLNPC